MIQLIWLAVDVASIFAAVAIARRREQNPLLWLVAALFVGPFAVLAVAFIRPKCDRCRRRVVPRSTVCSHCGTERTPKVYRRAEKEPERTYALGEKMSDSGSNVRP